MLPKALRKRTNLSSDVRKRTAEGIVTSRGRWREPPEGTDSDERRNGPAIGVSNAPAFLRDPGIQTS